MKNVKWKKSEGNFVESSCGRFLIFPEYWGRCKPQGYKLKDKKSGYISYLHKTQKNCKDIAEEIIINSKN